MLKIWVFLIFINLVQSTNNVNIECEEAKADIKSDTCTLANLHTDGSTHLVFRSSEVTWWWFIKEKAEFEWYTNIHVITSKTKSIPRAFFRQYTQLQTLTMKETGIEEWHPLTFILAKNLKHLIIPNNEIQTLPQIAFFGANVIETIDMENNKLTDVNQNAFINLQTLKTLILKGNLLKQLTLEFITNDKLSLIDISENQLEKFHLKSDAILEVHQRKEFKIRADYNKISDFHVQDTFPVTALYLKNNRLSGMATVINLKTLTFLNLESNPLGILPLTTFFTLTQLEYLNVNDALMTNLNAALFARLVKLKHLDISHNNFTTIDWNTLAALSNLEELAVYEHKMTIEDADHLATIFPNLKRVWISGSNWECEDFDKIADRLRKKNIKVNDGVGEYETVSFSKGVFCVPTLFLG